MKTDIINEVAAASLAQKITFPEVIQKLIAAGVERYQVDLVAPGTMSVLAAVNPQMHRTLMSKFNPAIHALMYGDALENPVPPNRAVSMTSAL